MIHILTRPFRNALFGRARSMQQGSLLWVLATAVQNEQPLAPVVDAFAEDARGRWQGQLWALAELLNVGTPLADALDQLPGILPSRSILAISIGADAGSLKVALREEATRFATELGGEGQQYDGFVSYLWYPCILALVMLQIVGFVMYFIIPKFKKIYEGFDVELPGITVALIEFSDVVVMYWYLFVLLGIGLLGVAAVRADDEGLLSRGPFSWLAGSRLRQAIPDILRHLSVFIEVGRPLPGAILKLMEFHPSASVRRCLNEAESALQQGQDCCHALLAGRLINPAQAVFLESAQRAGNLPWALRETADTIERRQRQRLAILMEFLRPAMLLCFGAMVAFVVVGLFMPLIKLVHDLS